MPGHWETLPPFDRERIGAAAQAAESARTLDEAAGAAWAALAPVGAPLPETPGWFRAALVDACRAVRHQAKAVRLRHRGGAAMTFPITETAGRNPDGTMRECPGCRTRFLPTEITVCGHCVPCASRLTLLPAVVVPIPTGGRRPRIGGTVETPVVDAGGRPTGLVLTSTLREAAK